METEFKTEIQCSNCGDHWMVGDRERTIQEKRQWVCPKCQELASYKINSKPADEQNKKGGD